MKLLFNLIILLVCLAKCNISFSQTNEFKEFEEIKNKNITLLPFEAKNLNVVLFEDSLIRILTSVSLLRNNILPDGLSVNLQKGDSLLLLLIEKSNRTDNLVNASVIAIERRLNVALKNQTLSLLEKGNCYIEIKSTGLSISEIKVQYYKNHCGYRCYEQGRKFYIIGKLYFETLDVVS
jgi:hypothetical protein